MKTYYVPIVGTWGGEWARSDSPFAQYLASCDFAPVFREPLDWTGDVDWLSFGRRRHRDWRAGASALSYYLNPPKPVDDAWRSTYVPILARNAIAHSHGGQVALYACADHDLKLRTLVTIGTPIRKDMADVAARAAKNIRRWMHLRSDRSDLWQLFGAIGDGRVGAYRDFPIAGVVNHAIPGIGHSGILERPEWFHLWEDQGWLDAIRKAA